jgi:hypothetical protein
MFAALGQKVQQNAHADVCGSFGTHISKDVLYALPVTVTVKVMARRLIVWRRSNARARTVAFPSAR